MALGVRSADTHTIFTAADQPRGMIRVYRYLAALAKPPPARLHLFLRLRDHVATRQLYDRPIDRRACALTVLKKIMRGTGPGRGKKERQADASFKAELKRLNLNDHRAIEAQRIGALPWCDTREIISFPLGGSFW
jgi:hypothetical protein